MCLNLLKVHIVEQFHQLTTGVVVKCSLHTHAHTTHNTHNTHIQYTTYNTQHTQHTPSPSHPPTQTEVCLLYDAVILFAKALTDLDGSRHVDVTPLHCSEDKTWIHGDTLVTYIKWVGGRRGAVWVGGRRGAVWVLQCVCCSLCVAECVAECVAADGVLCV